MTRLKETLESTKLEVGENKVAAILIAAITGVGAIVSALGVPGSVIGRMVRDQYPDSLDPSQRMRGSHRYSTGLRFSYLPDARRRAGRPTGPSSGAQKRPTFTGRLRAEILMRLPLSTPKELARRRLLPT